MFFLKKKGKQKKREIGKGIFFFKEVFFLILIRVKISLILYNKPKGYN